MTRLKDALMKTNLSLSTSDLNLTALRLVSKLIASNCPQRTIILDSDWSTNKFTHGNRS